MYVIKYRSEIENWTNYLTENNEMSDYLFRAQVLPDLDTAKARFDRLMELMNHAKGWVLITKDQAELEEMVESVMDS